MSAKKEKKPLLEVGTRVFAKVRGYPAWPARVEEVQGGSGNNAKYKVFFYGTYESASVKAPDIWKFDEKSKVRFGKQKRKGFIEALQEIENNPGIQTVEMLEGAIAAVTGEAPVEQAAAAGAAAAAAAASSAPTEDGQDGEEEEGNDLHIDESETTPAPKTTPRSRKKSGILSIRLVRLCLKSNSFLP